MSTNDLERARRLVLRFGWNAVSYQILNPGFRYWFSDQCEATLGFVKRSGYWIVAGGPVCDTKDVGEVVTEFEESAARDQCKVCYFGAAERLYDVCRNPPAYSTVALGAQPWWNPERWPQIIAGRKSLRAQLNRARNKGVRIIEWASPENADRELIGTTPLSVVNRAALEACLKDWLAARPMPTMHFLVEPDMLQITADRRIFVALRQNAVCGFLVASPIPLRNGWLIEQIVRTTKAPNGTNELLLDHAMRALAASGAKYVTLGLVPLASQANAHWAKSALWLRLLLRWTRAHGRRFYNFQGLESFKSKFQPDGWEAIFAISNQATFSPRAMYAIAAAFSDKGSPIMQAMRALGRAVRQEARWMGKGLGSSPRSS